MGAHKIKSGEVITLPKEDKVKVAVIGLFNGKPAILNLTRSEQETSRIGGDDLLGGGLLPGELPYDGAVREAWEEARLKLDYLTELGIHKGRKHVWAAIGRGVVVLSHEHSDWGWIPVDEYEQSNLPDDYKNILLSKRSLRDINALAEIATREQTIVGYQVKRELVAA